MTTECRTLITITVASLHNHMKTDPHSDVGQSEKKRTFSSLYSLFIKIDIIISLNMCLII